VSRSARPALAGIAVVVAVVVALPLLLSVLALGPGGLPHEAGLHAASTHDTSLAALDRVDRYLHGDLSVVLAPAFDAPATDGSSPPPVPPVTLEAVAAAASHRAPAGRLAAESERSL
jgi:hypothetical protein